jgi:hypothetical protein
MSCNSRSSSADAWRRNGLRENRRRVLAAGFALLCSVGAAATSATPEAAPAPAEVERALGQPRLQGEGRLRMFGFQVYDSRLWRGEATVPSEGWSSVPLALEIAYLRALKGVQIAERSLIEMRRQRELAPDEAGRWLKAMQAAFPDVKAGDRIVGVVVPAQGMRFYVNGRRTAEIAEAEFARLFTGIWLAPQSSQPALRQALLGGSATAR